MNFPFSHMKSYEFSMNQGFSQPFHHPRLFGSHLGPHVGGAGDERQADLVEVVARGVGQGSDALVAKNIMSDEWWI